MNLLTSTAGSVAVGAGTSYFFLGLLVLMILALAFEEKLHANKSVITGVAAVIVLVFGEYILNYIFDSSSYLYISCLVFYSSLSFDEIQNLVLRTQRTYRSSIHRSFKTCLTISMLGLLFITIKAN